MSGWRYSLVTMRRHVSVVLIVVGAVIAAYACVTLDTPENDSLRNGDAGLNGQLRLGFESEMAIAYGKVPERSTQIDVIPADPWRTIEDIARLIEAELLKSGNPDAAHDTEVIWQEMHDYLLGFGAFGESQPEAVLAAERLPACYRLYLRSLTPNRDEALKAIEQLLELPPAERKPLEAVAHYRRGRLLHHAILDMELREKAGKETTVARLRELRKSLEAVETAVANGSTDVAFVRTAALHWLIDSYGDLPSKGGEMLKEEVDYPKVAALHLRQRSMGDAGADKALERLMWKLSEIDEGLEICRKDKELRRLMTIELSTQSEFQINLSDNVEQGSPEAIGRWLSLFLYGDPIEDDETTAHLALIFYNRGYYAVSEKLVAKCPPDDIVAAMLRSRLELRLGRRLEAAKALELAVPKLAPVTDFPHWGVDNQLGTGGGQSWIFVRRDLPHSAGGKLRAELAMLKLALGDYPAALRLNLGAGLIWDARYVAECVMSIDELKAFVDAEAMGPRVRKRGFGEYDGDIKTIDLNEEIRVLLARRLCRAGRWLEAKPYVRPGMAAQIDAYLGLLAKAADAKAGKRERADAYWRAALLMREHGRELIYCDFGPWHTTAIEYPQRGSTGWVERDWPRCRIEPTQEQPWNPLTGPGPDERKRVQAWLEANPPPGNRENVLMKYQTLRLALLAAELLPDNDPAGANLLQFAGSEIMYVDPPAANAAYKLLATRFKETPFGKYAFEKRWFMKGKGIEGTPPDADWVMKAGSGGR